MKALSAAGARSTSGPSLKRFRLSKMRPRTSAPARGAITNARCGFFREMAEKRGLNAIDEITVEHVDAFRACRTINALTWTKRTSDTPAFLSLLCRSGMDVEEPGALDVLPAAAGREVREPIFLLRPAMAPRER